jgi:hypothetical protein
MLLTVLCSLALCGCATTSFSPLSDGEKSALGKLHLKEAFTQSEKPNRSNMGWKVMREFPEGDYVPAFRPRSGAQQVYFRGPNFKKTEVAPPSALMAHTHINLLTGGLIINESDKKPSGIWWIERDELGIHNIAGMYFSDPNCEVEAIHYEWQ